MSLSPWIKAARPRTLSLSMTPVIVGTALAWAVERQLRWPAVSQRSSAAFASNSAPICTMMRPVPNVAAMGRIVSDLEGDRVWFAGWRRRQTVPHAHVLRRQRLWVSIWFWSAAGRFFCSALRPSCRVGLQRRPAPIAYTPFGELFVVAFFGLGAVCGTYWLCTATLGSGRGRSRSCDWAS